MPGKTRQSVGCGKIEAICKEFYQQISSIGTENRIRKGYVLCYGKFLPDSSLINSYIH